MALTDQLRLEHPIVQAGMGGGIAGGRLAGAVSAAGALGTVGIGPSEYFSHQLTLAREIAPHKPLAANLLVPFTRRAHIDACRAAGVELAVLHAGFSRQIVDRLHAGGVLVLLTVGTVREAKRALAEGADGLVVQGIEAGGHLVGVERALEALNRVLPVVGNRPVLVAGGIADSDDVRRAIAAGAAAVVAGTRFLLTHESGAHPAYKRAVLQAERTIETRLFGFGWPMRHRVVPNAATERWSRPGHLVPPAVALLQQLSRPVARLPMSLTETTIRRQRVGFPVYGPAPPTENDSESLVESSALYAGETALRIEELVSAAEAVALLAGTGGTASPSPTIPTT